MRLIEDLHTHTVFSHGHGTIEENVQAALAQGLERIAISDHGPGHLGFGIKRRNLPVMRAEIARLSRLHPQIEILLAVEANVLGMDGSIDVTEDDREYYDLVLCGYHFGSRPVRFFRDLGLHLFNVLTKVSPVFSGAAKRRNTLAVIRALERNSIDILTHPGAKGPIDILAVAETAARVGTALEINNSHGHLTTEEIRVAMETPVRFIVGSDAHVPEDIGHCEDAARRITEAGLPLERVRNIREERA